jgi:alpha-L-arabinofuranosidase
MRDRFGTDEFIDYCRATGCKPYICLNSELRPACRCRAIR